MALTTDNIIHCRGCLACANICPKNAIDVVTDKKGFQIPFVNTHLCVNCHLCEKVCPISNTFVAREDFSRKAFALKLKDTNIRKRSQSGGAFWAMASSIIEKNGVVYGAALDENYLTKHIRITDFESLKKLQGVKYVQSDIGTCLKDVLEDLKAARLVLFSGTPCQISGLLSFLKNSNVSRDSLVTCANVCYGVPSPLIFSNWIKCLSKSEKSSITDFKFRQTDCSWGNGKEEYAFKNGKKKFGNFFTKLYFNNLIIRDSCHKCAYCNLNRPEDITIGDFWGIENVFPDFKDDIGVSLLIIHTPAGHLLFDNIIQICDIRECTVEDVVAGQPRLQGIPTSQNIHSDVFWEKYKNYGFEYIAQDEGFIPPTFRFKIHTKLNQLFK